MMKKSMDHRGGTTGILDTAFGYAMKARPGPANNKGKLSNRYFCQKAFGSVLPRQSAACLAQKEKLFLEIRRFSTKFLKKGISRAIVLHVQGLAQIKTPDRNQRTGRGSCCQAWKEMGSQVSDSWNKEATAHSSFYRVREAEQLCITM